MTISVNTIIQKITANNIVGVINDFNSRVINTAHTKVQYTSYNYPHFTGTATYGTTGASATSGWTNPQAIPSGHLVDNSQTTMTSIDGTVIVASSLWNSMLNITRTLVKIRKFTSNWYHRTDATNNLVNSITGYATFNTGFPTVPTGALNNGAKGESWTRNGSTSITLSPAQTIKTNEVITANNMNTAINNCYNDWVNKCYNNNILTYTLYTCHQNCHSSCHDSRGRR